MGWCVRNSYMRGKYFNLHQESGFKLQSLTLVLIGGSKGTHKWSFPLGLGCRWPLSWFAPFCYPNPGIHEVFLRAKTLTRLTRLKSQFFQIAANVGLFLRSPICRDLCLSSNYDIAAHLHISALVPLSEGFVSFFLCLCESLEGLS